MAYFRAGNTESTSSFDLDAISRQADALLKTFGQKRLEAERDLAEDIRREFETAIQGNAIEDGAALAEMARTAGRLSVSGLASVAEATMTRIREIAARKAAQEGDGFDPREETRRSERKDREEEMLRDFRQDARQRLQQMQEELEEHRKREQTLGGVTMTGQEWADAADKIRNDDRTRGRLLDYLMSQGLTREQAEREANVFADASAAMSKPESQRTQAERDAITSAANSRRFQGAMAIVKEESEIGFSRNTELDRASNFSENQSTVIAARSDRLELTDTEANLASGRQTSASSDLGGGINAGFNLRNHYMAAQTALVPLDAPSVPVQPTPEVRATAVQVAAASPDAFV